jgi:putative addiction module component (TIGR02574 family)
MSEGFTGVLSAALALPAGERVVLARKLIDSLEEEDQAAIDAAWVAEAQRRIAAYDRGEMGGAPAEEVFRNLKIRRPS